LLTEIPLKPSPPEPQSFRNAVRLQQLVEAELETICASASFRTSRKSCEFLQYVVRVALSGRVDSLKERSIGIDLFGRNVSYDPSSDASVRVRANEVRRRLASFYADHANGRSCRIHLPLGSYAPQFVLSERAEESAPTPPLAVEALPAPVLPAEPSIPVISRLTMFRPAGIALFLCAFFLRWQVLQSSPYDHFWGELLHGKSAITLDIDPSGPFLRESVPIAWLAGRYGVKPSLIEVQHSAALHPGDPVIHLAAASAPFLLDNPQLRFLIIQEKGRLHALDRATGSSAPLVAVVTVMPGDPVQLWINSVDENAAHRMIDVLTDPDRFPARLEQMLAISRVVQMALPADPSAPILFYEVAGQP
jgi:hypothetical protein